MDSKLNIVIELLPDGTFCVKSSSTREVLSKDNSLEVAMKTAMLASEFSSRRKKPARTVR